MPSVSAKQEKFMRAVAHSPKFAKKVGVPQSVGKEFEMKESKGMMKKEVAFMKKKGAPKSMVKHEMAEAGMKYGGKAKKMSTGGSTGYRKAADGVAQRGKTRGKVLMKMGGKACK